MSVPTEIRTSRFVLRPWRAGDAAALLPVLEANWEHLGPWIPARVATPAPVPELAVRLAGFEAEFEAGREWRYGMFAPDDGKVLGEVGLYPRARSRSRALSSSGVPIVAIRPWSITQTRSDSSASSR